MLAVVKTPRIDVRIKGDVPSRLLQILKREYGSDLKLVDDDDIETVDFFQTDFYRETKMLMTPGTYIKIYRENQGWTQEQLGEKLGVSKTFICDIEHGRRAVSKEAAKKLSRIFKIPLEYFIQ
jgi:DNA-binding XRE family transcriptional regulator